MAAPKWRILLYPGEDDGPALERALGRASSCDVVRAQGEEELAALLARGRFDLVIAGPGAHPEDLAQRARLPALVVPPGGGERAARLFLETRGEEPLAALLGTLPLAVYRAQPSGRITWVSENVEALLGIPAVRFVEEPDLWLARIHPDDRARVREALVDLGTLGRRDVEYRLEHANGRWLWLLDQAVHSGGEVLGTWSDISARKELELQLAQSQKMEAVGRLAGGVAHDFNNLLTTILTATGFALEETPPDSPAFDDLRSIEGAARQAADLTRRLLAFSRREALQPRVLELNAVVEETQKILQRLIGEDVEVTLALRPDAGSVWADPGHLAQVLLNLAVNARDAMPQGGRLTIETSREDVLDGARVPAGRYAVLAVRDTGTGMDCATRARIFEPFFTTKRTGTGLGLSMVYGIVQQCDGHIDVESEPERGTTFRIYLPRIEGPSHSAEEAKGGAPGSERILIVDDEKLVRTAARRVLVAAGYDVLEAENPESALRIAREDEGPIHLLLTDVVMPGMSGRAVADAVRFARPGLKVLYMSGYTDDAVARHGEAGAEILEKPFTSDGLKRKVRQILDAP
jgi:signal transduction histidine kinase